MCATVYFSDGTKIVISEGDSIIPITPSKSNDPFSASMADKIEVYNHTHNGLVPSLMDVFCNCDFFYVNNDFYYVYGTKSIIKILTEL